MISDPDGDENLVLEDLSLSILLISDDLSLLISQSVIDLPLLVVHTSSSGISMSWHPDLYTEVISSSGTIFSFGVPAWM